MRNYRQYCGLAASLDVVGERWTLLVVRELFIGPRRYGELLADLPGMGTNLLAERLKFLCRMGVLTKNDQFYELTERGKALAEPMRALTRWGVDFLGDPTEETVCRPHWGLLGMRALADASDMPELDESYEFRVDDEVFHLRASGGVARVGRGPAERPAMVLTTDAKTFIRLGARSITAEQATGAGLMSICGDPRALARCAKVLGLARKA